MKIWVLRAKRGLRKGNDPWDPWYDKAFGFVVRAKNEQSARAMAHERAGDENRGEFLGKVTSKTDAPWLDPSYSTCEELLRTGEAEVILRDFASA